MITAEETRAEYRADMICYGQQVTFRRADGSLPDALVWCRMVGYAPSELVGGIIQGDVRVIALAEDFEAAGWPAPEGGRGKDQIILATGAVLSVESVDANTRKIGSTVIAYEIQARG